MLVRTGRVDEAAALVADLLPRAREIDDPQVLAPALAGAALAEQARGRFSEAVNLVEELDERTRDPFRAIHVPDAVRICAAAGSLSLGRKLLDGVPTAMTRHRYVRLTGEAVVAEAEGHLEQAAEQYAQAAERWRDYGHLPEQALALLGQGHCLVTLGRPAARAEPPLREARKLFASIGYKTAIGETDILIGQTAAAPVSRHGS